MIYLAYTQHNYNVQIEYGTQLVRKRKIPILVLPKIYMVSSLVSYFL